MAGEIKASPRNQTLGKVADKLARLRDLANKYEVLPQVPLLGGTGIGDLLMGQAPEEVSNWSYGNAPMQVPEMTRIPQMKTGRAAPVADALFLGADVGALGGLAASLGRRGLSEFVGSAGRAMPVGAEPQVGAIKPKGGNWIQGNIGRRLSTLKKNVYSGDEIETLQRIAGEQAAQNYLTQNAPNYALNSWIDKTLNKYIGNELATPEDPLRALAERGIGSTAYSPDILDILITQPNSFHQNRRVSQGFPAEGLGKSQLAKSWETRSDTSISTIPVKKLLDNNLYAKEVAEMPWLSKLNPDDVVYELNTLDGLGFRHLLDELANATNPDSGLPADLLLKYESLPKVTVPQAVERVAKINEWRAKQKAEADAARAMNPATQVFKEYPDQGYKWVELKAPEKTGKTVKSKTGPSNDDLLDEARELALDDGLEEGTEEFDEYVESYIENSPLRESAVDVDESYKALEDALKYEGETMGHCVGGYCPDVIEGRSRIYSLRDAKGMPHVTVEVQPPGMRNDALFDAGIDFEEQAALEVRRQNPRIDDESDEYMEAVMARAQELADEWNTKQATVEQPRIAQIKGKGNAKPKDDYLPFVQDFVKSQQWSEIGDLGNTGLVEYSTRRQTIPRGLTGVIPKFDEAGIKPGYYTESELSDLIKAWQSTNGSRNFAQGGLVTPYDPARIEALVSQLMDAQ